MVSRIVGGRVLLSLVAVAVFVTTYLIASSSRTINIDRFLDRIATDSGIPCRFDEPCVSKEAQYNLILFMSAYDCPGSTYVTQALNDAYRRTTRNSLNIIGVVSDMSHDEAARFRSISGIDYPMLVHTDEITRVLPNPRPPNARQPTLLLLKGSTAIVDIWNAATVLRSHENDLEALIKLVED